MAVHVEIKEKMENYKRRKRSKNISNYAAYVIAKIAAKNAVSRMKFYKKFVRSQANYWWRITRCLTNGEEISALKFGHSPDRNIKPTQSPTPHVTCKEIPTAISKMKNGRVIWADNIPVEFWKIRGPIGIIWLNDLMKRII